MYPKFVLVSRPETPLIGTFIYGLVWNHKDLVDALPAYVKVHGGGWYDPYDCDRIDTYLEQAYLTAFAKAKELMMFCWPSLAGDKRATPLGFMYQKLDRILSKVGEPTGLKVFIPFNSQGEDHIEDYLGMAGVPMEPVCDFPEYKEGARNKVLLTAAALKDEKIVEKIRGFVEQGGHAIVTSGFMIGALKKYPEILELTSIRYNDRVLTADEFQSPSAIGFGKEYIKSKNAITFPLLEHRNNATWSMMNAGHGEYHESILCFDTYGKGRLTTLVLPDMPSRIYELPAQVLAAIRKELEVSDIWIDAPAGVSVFTYDNKTFGVYAYTWDGCTPQEFTLYVKGEHKALKRIPDSDVQSPWLPSELPVRSVHPISFREKEMVSEFFGRVTPGEFMFFAID